MLWPAASPLLRASYRSLSGTPIYGPRSHPGESPVPWRRRPQGDGSCLRRPLGLPLETRRGRPSCCPSRTMRRSLATWRHVSRIEATPGQAFNADFTLNADAPEFTPGVLAINEITTPELGQSMPPEVLQSVLISTGAVDGMQVDGLSCDGLAGEAPGAAGLRVDAPVEGMGMDIGMDMIGVEALEAGFDPQAAHWLPEVRGLTGWTVIWVGERAFRASGAKKDQIGQEGFLVKVYRSQAESRALIAYLWEHSAGDLQVIVDADGGTGDPERLCEELGLPEDQPHGVAIARRAGTKSCASCATSPRWRAAWRAPPRASWRPTVRTASVRSRPWRSPPRRSPAAAGGRRRDPPRGGGASSSAGAAPAGASSAGADANADGADGKWTLLWVSELAFKPSAVALKARLEALGCQVKGYKAHRNAARALDKKRTLTRTIALVSSGEAVPLLAYFTSRPELGVVPAVVESAPRGASVRSSEHVEVVEDFEAAVVAIQRVAANAGFT
ncbi:unnamed protein product [Prorocentrum cordatum]|uniref:Uncharacterized protein n=1 Tax=Prorocentrum cordatum TaxID=2364126 RepID=A0ABN9WT26_9DINO|nr:unnamed protein product [Polarella glacialis]